MENSITDGYLSTIEVHHRRSKIDPFDQRSIDSSIVQNEDQSAPPSHNSTGSSLTQIDQLLRTRSQSSIGGGMTPQLAQPIEATPITKFSTEIIRLIAYKRSITTLITVVPIKVIGHKSSRTAHCVGTLLPQPLDLPGVIDLVELQHSQLHLLLVVLELLWLSVGLLLLLLGTTAKAEHQVESGLLLDVKVGQTVAVLELLAGEDEALLVRRDSLLVQRDSLPLGVSRRSAS
ncbi:hypothetical protein LWI29_012353 [Acer saccharum]|uniref:Uncharacterized protein n=1 Tax=Acer saccharum TaxID=4024 RepID=A0AA39T9M6_ACESA|nr:hypothetical protein LWI29_012353 [Acer saccharum]